MDEWTKVEENMPENNADVLFYDKARILGYYIEGHGFYSIFGILHKKTTHWMLAPNKPI